MCCVSGLCSLMLQIVVDNVPSVLSVVVNMACEWICGYVLPANTGASWHVLSHLLMILSPWNSSSVAHSWITSLRLSEGNFIKAEFEWNGQNLGLENIQLSLDTSSFRLLSRLLFLQNLCICWGFDDEKFRCALAGKTQWCSVTLSVNSVFCLSAQIYCNVFVFITLTSYTVHIW